LLGVDELPALGGEFLGDQPGYGDVHPVRIGEVAVAVGEGDLLRLVEEVDALGIVPA
jgi:hypothetical protein